MTFIRRHFLAFALCVIALILTFAASWTFGGFQIGIGPEFVVKAFAKLFYLGFAFICTHIVVKYMFPTIYKFTHSAYEREDSEFRFRWTDYKRSGSFDQRIAMAVQTHLGVFIGVCLLLALAF